MNSLKSLKYGVGCALTALKIDEVHEMGKFNRGPALGPDEFHDMDELLPEPCPGPHWVY